MSDWREGTEVEFSVKGRVNPVGNVVIGCKTFTQDEVREVANRLTATESKPKYQKGDVYAAGEELRWRDERGRWATERDGIAAYSDADAEAYVREYADFRFVIVGGKLVA